MLVIIGLIVGGILVGHELIDAARMRAQARQIEAINRAVLAFKMKYNCLPGDCASATQFFSTVTNGDGNGTIDRGDPGNSYQYAWQWQGIEWKSVFDHLAAAMLYPMADYDESAGAVANNHPGVAYPKCEYIPSGRTLNARRGLCGLIVSFEFTGHFLRLGATDSDMSGPTYLDFYAGFTPLEAGHIDSKYDDGRALSGKWQIGALGLQSTDGVTDMRTDAIHGSVGPETYRCADVDGTFLTHNNRSCSPRIAAMF